jgi:hypothetical protein
MRTGRRAWRKWLRSQRKHSARAVRGEHLTLGNIEGRTRGKDFRRSRGLTRSVPSRHAHSSG